jgi:hypothetical protein
MLTSLLRLQRDGKKEIVCTVYAVLPAYITSQQEEFWKFATGIPILDRIYQIKALCLLGLAPYGVGFCLEHCVM